MSKVKDVIQYIEKTSLFEKQQIVNALLKDFRLENEFKSFYEQEFKKDKEELKQIVANEIHYELDAKLVLLEKDNASLNQQLLTIHDTYKSQLQQVGNNLSEFRKKADTIEKQFEEQYKRKEKELKDKHYEQAAKHHEQMLKSKKQIEELENKIEKQKIFLSNKNGAQNSKESLDFLEKKYFILNESVLKSIRKNIDFLYIEINELLKKIFKKSNIVFNFKTEIMHFFESKQNIFVTESIIYDWYDFLKEIELNFIMDGKIIQYKPFSLLTENIYNVETFYEEVIKGGVA